MEPIVMFDWDNVENQCKINVVSGSRSFRLGPEDKQNQWSNETVCVLLYRIYINIVNIRGRVDFWFMHIVVIYAHRSDLCTCCHKSWSLTPIIQRQYVLFIFVKYGNLTRIWELFQKFAEQKGIFLDAGLFQGISSVRNLHIINFKKILMEQWGTNQFLQNSLNCILSCSFYSYN